MYDVITTGAISISNMMMVNHSLQQLYMGGNNIGDDGISAIARELRKCKVKLLSFNQCGITITGARPLATALSSHTTIRQLSLWNNCITVEGAQQIIEAAVDNEVTLYVVIDNEYENDKIKEMFFILERRKHEVRDCFLI